MQGDLDVEKVSYKLLKKLYQKDKMTLDEIKAETKYDGEPKYDPHISYLLEEHLISSFSEGEKFDSGKIIDGTQYYRITLRGRDYIENVGREKRNFWVPYAITTILALISVVATLLSLFQTVCPFCG